MLSTVQAIELIGGRTGSPPLDQAYKSAAADDRKIFLGEAFASAYEFKRFAKRISDFHFAAPRNVKMKRD